MQQGETQPEAPERAPHPDQQPLHTKTKCDLLRGPTHRTQQTDFTGFPHDGHQQRARDGESGDDDNKCQEEKDHISLKANHRLKICIGFKPREGPRHRRQHGVQRGHRCIGIRSGLQTHVIAMD